MYIYIYISNVIINIYIYIYKIYMNTLFLYSADDVPHSTVPVYLGVPIR